MCGLTGFIDRREISGDLATAQLRRMADQILHRGPDADGFWVQGQLGVGLAHRRLSIQDLSPLGAQPMTSASGRFVMAFNGEIYNFLELREQLEALGHSFRGHSDTEVMLAAFEEWGLKSSLQRFVGMFAFALCDLQEKRLYLGRDRMGEKPMYYGWQGTTFLFGSELKALAAHPSWKGEINRNSLTLLLRHNYIPAPHSIYRDIFKLEPACFLQLNLEEERPEVQISRYWDLQAAYRQAARPMQLEDRLAEVGDLLKRSIRQQMISDVPLGAFLSGGIDSSLVVSLMQAQSSRPVKTFSIGFHEPEFNEAEHAKAVAKHLGTEHTELYVRPEDALNVIPRLPQMYDEPFADSSQIPTYLVCEMTRKHVTVALSGDGGDELFCGYSRFFSSVSAWNRLRASKLDLKGIGLSLPEGLLAPVIKGLVPSQRALDLDTIKEKLRRLKTMRSAASLQQFYQRQISYWFEPEDLVLNAREPEYAFTSIASADVTDDPYRQLMLLDSLTYLPDDILVKVDRASMACSLETRVPFLDYRLVEYAASIPPAENIAGGSGKQLLKQLLYRHVPRELIDRPKRGFAVPLVHWLRGPLRDWGEALLEENKLKSQGFFDAQRVRQKWSEHQAGRVDHSFLLWGILCFQAWYEQLPGRT